VLIKEEIFFHVAKIGLLLLFLLLLSL
jgi:hypothetical protein